MDSNGQANVSSGSTVHSPGRCLSRSGSGRRAKVQADQSDNAWSDGGAPIKSCEDDRATRKTATPSWMSMLLAFMSVSFLLAAFTGRYQHLRITPTEPFSKGSNIEPRLEQVLHPEKYSSRLPTTTILRWRLSTAGRSPDGVSKRVYLINDEFPGPLVEARSGDVLKIHVINALDDEGVAIHFHGLHMRASNQMDGAVGFTQDPILPGEEFIYHFQISDTQAGTFWYHAHDQVQRGDGIFGPLIVHPPTRNDDQSDESASHEHDEERVITVGDWYHRSANEALAWYMRAGSFGMEPVPDSILVSGVGAYNCSKVVPARPVHCDQIDGNRIPNARFNGKKTYKLRVINTGMLAGISLSIQGATLKVIEVDGGHPIMGEEAPSIGVLYPGQRADLLLRWTNDISKSSITFTLDSAAFRYPNSALSPSQTFPFFVSEPRSEPKALEILPHFDLGGAHAQVDRKAALFPPTADKVFVLYTTTLKLARLSNVPYGFMNHTSWKPQSPPLISLPRSKYNSDQFIPMIPSHSPPLWVDIVLNNLDDDHHPFHLHGHDAYILQTYISDYGWGSWNPFENEVPPGGPLNVIDPVLRDTFVVPSRGYVVLRFLADNPGIWMLHCHVLWHQASGMAMGFEVAETM